MSFEKQFPSIKTELCNCDDLEGLYDLHCHVSTIEKYCLDKVLVKQKIKKYFEDIIFPDKEDKEWVVKGLIEELFGDKE